jgi:uncharacterized membrane protein
MLARYDDVFPGCSERIVAMAERQATHRQDLEKIVIARGGAKENLGVASGFTIAIVAILGGVFLVYSGKDVAGYATIFLPLAGLIAVFFRGKANQHRRIEDKNRDLLGKPDPG